MAAALVSALDTHTPIRTGKNGHAEYGWSNDIREEIVQLSFQTVRTSKDGVKNLGERFYSIVSKLNNLASQSQHTTTTTTSLIQETETQHLLDMMRRMVIQTRDIENGKGEYSIGREYIRQWYRIYPEEALKMIKYYVTPIPMTTEEGVTSTHPYGSWKDIKFFWQVFGGERCPPKMLDFLIRLVNNQLREDITSGNPSLAARWVSRENACKKGDTPFKSFYRALAEDYFSEYMKTAKTVDSKERARRKCYTHYRQKVLTPLNKKLNTPQIRQCAGEWSKIDYKNDVTSITMRKQTRAFMNQKKDGSTRSDNPDRIQAAENFDTFVNTTIEKGETIKGKRVGFEVIAKDAWNMMESYSSYSAPSTTQRQVLNLQWENMLEKLGDMGSMIPMIDLSGSMLSGSGNAFYAAIGIGLAVATKSCIGKRAMTFSTTPQWMNFDENNTLSEMTQTLWSYRNDWGGSTNFTAALTKILDKCVELKLPAAEVANLKLLVLSDMQIDSYGNENVTDTMWKNITKRYAQAGMRAIGEPYKPGHIIFWNLQKEDGFPSLSTTPNVTMFAGFSPVLLNEFALKGLEALQSNTPFNQLKEQLDHPRYNILDFA